MEATLGSILGNGGISGWGLGLLITVAWMTGRIKTRRDYDDQVKRADKAEEDARYWREAAMERSSQVAQLLPAAEVTTKLIEAMVERRPVDGEQ